MTILAISHQPALVEAADVVYRLEAGAFHRLERATALPAALSGTG
jgi:ABC-type transport system involved in cytochrome bd biosynthesis fused ATPase/permease subunit